MKLTYAIAFEDFKTLQPPFTRGGSNLGFKGVLFACGLIGLLGVFCLGKGMGLPVGLFLIGLGAGLRLLAASTSNILSVQRRKRRRKSWREAFNKSIAASKGCCCFE